MKKENDGDLWKNDNYRAVTETCDRWLKISARQGESSFVIRDAM